MVGWQKVMLFCVPYAIYAASRRHDLVGWWVPPTMLAAAMCMKAYADRNELQVAWPLWCSLMFLGVPLSIVIGVVTWNENFLVALFLPVLIALLGAVSKVVYEDCILKAQDPNYVTTWEIMRPVLLIWLILKGPMILVYVVLAIYAAYSVWG